MFSSSMLFSLSTIQVNFLIEMVDTQTSQSYLYEEIIVLKSHLIFRDETITLKSIAALTIEKSLLHEHELNESQRFGNNAASRLNAIPYVPIFTQKF